MVFFKQKTAYEIRERLVGSEMCIRDRLNTDATQYESETLLSDLLDAINEGANDQRIKILVLCLLYTSDAADDSLRVDLGGRRIIKKAQYWHSTYRVVGGCSCK